MVIARLEIPTGTLLTKESVRAVVTIPAGHKIAVRAVAQGKPVRRYNQIIGFATRDIAAGEHVHVHNIAMGDFQRDYAFSSLKTETQYFPEQATFQGIVRADGRVATRNYIGILTSVNCSATVARMIARHFENRLDEYPNVDGVVALTHKTGCGMASEGEATDILRRTIAGYARHPNFFSSQLVGLGCEANQINNLLSAHQLKRGDKLRRVHHPGEGRHAQGGGSRHRAREGDAAGGEPRQARNRTRISLDPRAAMRRLGRLLRHQRQPRARRRGGPAGAPRRHGDPVRDARNLWRGAPADAPRRIEGSRREADRAHQVVGGVHRAGTATK